jgi:GMP synthase (glutamine-hydrolysing)
MSHTDRISEVPEGFVVTSKTDNCPIASFESKERNIYATQFHPEVRHTIEGQKSIENFVLNICKCEPTWKSESFIDEQIRLVREQVGDKKVLLGLSGGVDSAVVAALLSKAIGKNLYCVFVDHGLLRKMKRKKSKLSSVQKVSMISTSSAPMLKTCSIRS